MEEYVAQGDIVVAIGTYTAVVKSTWKGFNSPVTLKRHLALGDTAATASCYMKTAPAG